MRIKQVNNGYIVTDNDYCDFIYEKIQDVMFHVLEVYAPGTKHDAERLYLVTAPGENHKNFTDAHSDIIWPELV
jgi:hypothetical protein